MKSLNKASHFRCWGDRVVQDSRAERQNSTRPGGFTPAALNAESAPDCSRWRDDDGAAGFDPEPPFDVDRRLSFPLVKLDSSSDTTLRTESFSIQRKTDQLALIARTSAALSSTAIVGNSPWLLTGRLRR